MYFPFHFHLIFFSLSLFFSPFLLPSHRWPNRFCIYTSLFRNPPRHLERPRALYAYIYSFDISASWSITLWICETRPAQASRCSYVSFVASLLCSNPVTFIPPCTYSTTLIMINCWLADYLTAISWVDSFYPTACATLVIIFFSRISLQLIQITIPLGCYALGLHTLAPSVYTIAPYPLCLMLNLRQTVLAPWSA